MDAPNKLEPQKRPMSWFRMYHEFSTDPKVQMLSEVDQRRYVMLLCLRCCNGDVTLQETEVAFQLRVSLDEWQATKATLVGKNLIKQDNTPAAWYKRQYVSDSSAERVARHREKLKQASNVTVTPQTQRPEPETDKDQEDRGGLGGSFKASQGPVWRVTEHIMRETRYAVEEKAKRHNWDFLALCDKYNAWVKDNPPKAPDRAFPVWADKFLATAKQ